MKNIIKKSLLKYKKVKTPGTGFEPAYDNNIKAFRLILKTF